MTEPPRTVAAVRDLPRLRRWINSQVRAAVNDAARAFADIRYYCDHLDQALVICRERNDGQPCVRCAEAARVAAHFRSLLPELPPERRAEPTKEVRHGNASDQAGRRPGPVSPDP